MHDELILETKDSDSSEKAEQNQESRAGPDISLQEHRSRLSMEKAHPPGSKLSEKAAYKRRIRKKASYGRMAEKTLGADAVPKKQHKSKWQRNLTASGNMVVSVGDKADIAIHQKIHENEDDNASVEAAHETETAVENAVRISGNRFKQQVKKRESRLKFDERDAPVNAGEAKNTEAVKKHEANKGFQKRKVKQSYADAFRKQSEGASSSKLVEGAKEAVRGGVQKAGAFFTDFAKKNYGALIALMCVGILFVMIMVSSGTIATMLSEAGGSFVESTYLSSDEDIIHNDEAYMEMEEKLQDQIDNIESSYSGYDEYRYQVDEISHDPYALASYFTAKYGNYKAADISSELLPLFQNQYTLTITEEVEIRTRAVTVTDPETGEESEEEETYEWYVLNVRLVNKGMDAIARAELPEKQLFLYDTYQSSKGNRSYLFGEHPGPGNVAGGGLNYDIPPEALEDAAFARMINEAEKYLGKAYVWGGSSPETGFDCSGFVSWVINHSGNGWNVGRQTANGLMSSCTYVSAADAKPGDLIFFEKTYNTAGASHVGIYVGDGMMLHCGNPIQYTSIESNYWKQHFLSFGRIN